MLISLGSVMTIVAVASRCVWLVVVILIATSWVSVEAFKIVLGAIITRATTSVIVLSGIGLSVVVSVRCCRSCNTRRGCVVELS